tara:strand:- start:1500 stop:2297 length:798 start_codon:yes stop_codon:yes gene_type:complete
MQYVLGFNFSIFKHYKKIPSVRFYIDNHFIDEFDIDLKSKEIEKGWYTKNNEKYKTSYMPNQLKLYLFESSKNFTQDSVIRFEIDNDDSNYTNGFMTKSTLVSLDTIFLVPLYFFKDKGAFAKKFLERLKYIEDYYIEPLKPLTYKNADDESRDKKRLANLKPKYIGKPLELADEGILSRLTLWPIATHITWTKDGATPENLYFTDGKDKSSFGGSGTIRLKIAKKHGLYLLTGMDSQLGGVWRTHKVFDAILHNTDIINSINEN